MSAVADVLNGAVRLIERDGWRQHSLGHSGAPRCIAGALKGAAGCEMWTSDWDEAMNLVADVLGLDPLDEEGCQSVSEWNDTPGRTKAEVVAALRAAAERAA